MMSDVAHTSAPPANIEPVLSEQSGKGTKWKSVGPHAPSRPSSEASDVSPGASQISLAQVQVYQVSPVSIILFCIIKDQSKAAFSDGEAGITGSEEDRSSIDSEAVGQSHSTPVVGEETHTASATLACSRRYITDSSLTIVINGNPWNHLHILNHSTGAAQSWPSSPQSRSSKQKALSDEERISIVIYGLQPSSSYSIDLFFHGTSTTRPVIFTPSFINLTCKTSCTSVATHCLDPSDRKLLPKN